MCIRLRVLNYWILMYMRRAPVHRRGSCLCNFQGSQTIKPDLTNNPTSEMISFGSVERLLG